MFEKLQEKVKGYGNSIRQGTQKITDTQNVNKRLEALGREQNDLFRELGEKYFLRCKDAVPEEDAAVFEKIEEIERFKSDCRKELLAIRGVWVCDSCGNENVKEARFCGNCGAARPAETASKEEIPAPEVCQNCGKPVPAEAVFCGSCGARIIRASAPEEETAPEEESVPEAEPVPQEDAEPEDIPFPEPTRPE